MIKRVGLHAFIAGVLVISTCSPSALQVQARVANSVGLAGNRALPLLIEAYQVEGIRIIEQARAEERAEDVVEEQPLASALRA